MIRTLIHAFHLCALKKRTILLIMLCSLPACGRQDPSPMLTEEAKTAPEPEVQDNSAQIYAVIYRLLEEEGQVQEKMQELISACERDQPKGNWRALKDLQFEREIPRLRDQWLATVLAKHPPIKVGVNALWFGLFNPIYEVGEVADFYIAGGIAETYDDNADWASSPKYFPEGRYAHSEVLAAIHHIAYGQDTALGSTAEEYVCLGYVAFVIKEILPQADVKLVVSDDALARIAIGWDSGDALYIGTLTRHGFQPLKPDSATHRFDNG